MTSAEYKKITACITRISDGNTNAFADIYSMYEKKVFFLCCKITGSKTASADIVKDTFSYVYKNITHISNTALFDKWVYVAAANRCKAFFKKTDSTKYDEYRDSDEQPADDIDAVLAVDEKRNVSSAGNFEITVEKMKATDRIIASLPQKIRIAFIHYYFSGLSFEEIAQYEGISVNAVKNRILYARINLQSSVNEAITAGCDLRGLIPSMSYMLETMASSVIVPRELATAVTVATGVACISSESEYATAPDNTPSEQQFISDREIRDIPPKNNEVIRTDEDEENDDDGYYDDEEEKPSSYKIHKAETMTPTVKILIGVICVLILIIGAIAVSVMIKHGDKEGITDFDTTVSTTAENKTVTKKMTTSTTEKTTKPTTQTTTAPSTTQTTAAPETTTQSQIPVYTQPAVQEPEENENEEQNEEQGEPEEQAEQDENNG